MFRKNDSFWGFIVRIEVNQFGAAFLGISVTLATVNISPYLLLAVSIFASVFYLSLLYTAFWDKAAADVIKIDGGKATYHPWNGLKLSLVANVPNILLALLVIIGGIFAEETVIAEGITNQNWASQMHSICSVIYRVWNAFYWGILNIFKYPDHLHLVMVLPALLISALGYYAGLKNFKLLEYLHLSKGDRKTTQK